MVSVLGLARTGLIFTRIQEGAQLGGLTQTQPGQSRVFHTVCHRAGFQWGGGGTAGTHSRLGSAGASPVQENSSVLRTLFCGFVLCNPLFCIVVVPVPFLCCSVKLPLSRPIGFCLFLSILLRTPAGGGVAAWRFRCRLQPKPEHSLSTCVWNFTAKSCWSWNKKGKYFLVLLESSFFKARFLELSFEELS